ncbi:hypothetical protein Tco_0382586 [Tanacetum coccineum]
MTYSLRSAPTQDESSFMKSVPIIEKTSIRTTLKSMQSMQLKQLSLRNLGLRCLLTDLPDMAFIQLGGNSRVDEMILARVSSGFAREKVWEDIQVVPEFVLGRERRLYGGRVVVVVAEVVVMVVVTDTIDSASVSDVIFSLLASDGLSSMN